MLRFTIRRLLLTIPVLLGVATLVFSLLHLVPGDPALAMLGESASASDVDELRGKLGLDRPLPAQYAQFVAGLGGGMLGPPALSLTVQVHPERRAHMTSVVEGWFCAGSASWPLAVAALLGAGHSWKTAYLLAAAPMAVLAAGIAAVPFPSYHDPGRRDTGSRLALMRQPFFLLSCAAIVCYAITETGVQYFLPRYLKERFDPGVWLTGLSVSLFWGAMGAWRLIWPTALKRFTERQVLIGSMAVAVVMHGAAVWAGGKAGALMLFAGVGMAFGAVWPILVASVAARYAHMVGTATGTLIAWSAVGCALGPFLLGQVGGASSVQRAMWVAVGVTALTLAACALIPRGKPGNPPGGTPV